MAIPTGISNVADMLQGVLDDLALIQQASGYNLTIKPSSLYADPIALDAAQIVDVPIACLYQPTVRREFDNAKRVMDTVTFTIFVRADVTNPNDQDAKTALWCQMVADVEAALVGDDARIQRHGLAIFTELGNVEQPGMALASPIVILQQPVRVQMQPRTYGLPTSQG